MNKSIQKIGSFFPLFSHADAIAAATEYGRLTDLSKAVINLLDEDGTDREKIIFNLITIVKNNGHKEALLHGKKESKPKHNQKSTILHTSKDY